MVKYQQLVAQLRQQIEAQVWPPGEKLPPLRQQAEQSMMTVMHVYAVLERAWAGLFLSRNPATTLPRVLP